MYALLFLCLAVTCALQEIRAIELPPEVQEMVNDLHETCVKEIGVGEDDIKNYDFSSKDTKMKCYMACLMKNSKWMTPGGKVNYDHIENSAHEAIKELLMSAVQKCTNSPEGADDCETAYNFNNCMQKADPANYFLP